MSTPSPNTAHAKKPHSTFRLFASLSPSSSSPLSSTIFALLTALRRPPVARAPGLADAARETGLDDAARGITAASGGGGPGVRARERLRLRARVFSAGASTAASGTGAAGFRGRPRWRFAGVVGVGTDVEADGSAASVASGSAMVGSSAGGVATWPMLFFARLGRPRLRVAVEETEGLEDLEDTGATGLKHRLRVHDMSLSLASVESARKRARLTSI
jgi:hypothetical protein